MLSKHLKFDGVQIPNPTSYSEESETIDNQYETEAGGLNISVTRYDRLHISASFDVTSAWAAKLKNYSKQGLLTVTLFDLALNAESEHSMVIQNFKSKLVEQSEYTARTNGLWTVSFELQEL